jgi:hypothetical protein
MEVIKEYASLITAILVIGGFFVSIYRMVRTVEKMKEKIDERLEEIDASACKNFLVRFLKDVEQGNEVDEVETQRAHEVYEHYIKDLHKNSYIHSKWNKLMK